jgi:hypothetical protein
MFHGLDLTVFNSRGSHDVIGSGFAPFLRVVRKATVVVHPIFTIGQSTHIDEIK